MKQATKYVIIFGIVILIGLGSLVSMLFYSLGDRRTMTDKPIELKEATVQLYQSVDENVIKLEFYDIKEEKTQKYEVTLMNEQGDELESLLVTIDLKTDNMDEYIYEVQTQLVDVCFYRVDPVK